MNSPLEESTTYTGDEIAHILYNALFGSSILYLFIESITRLGIDFLLPYRFELNIILYFISFTAVYILFLSIQKYTARYLGLNPSYTSWTYGPPIGFAISILTYGFLPILYLGTIEVETDEKLRLGQIHQNINASELLTIGMSGILGIFLLITLVIEPLYLFTQLEAFRIFSVTAAATMFYQSLPFPHTNGANIILKNRYAWLATFTFTLLTFIFSAFITVYIYLIALFLTTVVLYLVNKYFTNLL